MSQYLDPRQRARSPIGTWEDGFEIITAATAPESEPAYIIPTGPTTNLLTHVRYDGTVTAATLRIWYYSNGVWYRGITTDSGIPLSGANETRLWEVSRDALCGFTVESIAGGGSLTVRAEAVK